MATSNDPPFIPVFIEELCSGRPAEYVRCVGRLKQDKLVSVGEKHGPFSVKADFILCQHFPPPHLTIQVFAELQNNDSKENILKVRVRKDYENYSPASIIGLGGGFHLWKEEFGNSSSDHRP